MKMDNRFIKMIFDGEGNDGSQDNGAQDNAAKPDNNGTNAAEKKYSDADVNRIVNQKFAEWQNKQQKAVDEATKLANMTAQEQAEAWQKKYNDLLAENNRATLTTQAVKMLADDGIQGVDDGVLKGLVTGEAETTKTNVANFIKVVNDKAQALLKEKSKRPTPQTGGIGKADKAVKPITREQIEAITDRHEKQRLISEHIDLFR